MESEHKVRKGSHIRGSPKPSAKRRARARARRRRPRLKLYAMQWQQRNEKQKSRYRKSLSVLDRVREGVSYSAACREQQISRATARRYLGKALYKDKSNRIRAHRRDSLLRNLQSKEKGKVVFLELSDSFEATKLSRYHKAVREYLENGSTELLNSFQDDGVVDSSGIFHSFEVNTKVLIELEEKKEDAELYEIYQP